MTPDTPPPQLSQSTLVTESPTRRRFQPRLGLLLHAMSPSDQCVHSGTNMEATLQYRICCHETETAGAAAAAAACVFFPVQRKLSTHWLIGQAVIPMPVSEISTISLTVCAAHSRRCLGFLFFSKSQRKVRKLGRDFWRQWSLVRRTSTALRRAQTQARASCARRGRAPGA